MELYMVRHGQTDFNKNKRLQGVIDIPLNEYGIELAEKTAEGLKDVPFDVIYSSPLSRAFQTAEIIRGDRPVEIIPTDSLLELSFGEYEGLICKGEHYNLPDPDFMKFFDNMEEYHVPPKGETIEHLVKRTSSFVLGLMNDPANADKTILLSSHGAAIRGLLTGIWPYANGGTWSGIVHKNCGVTCLHVENGRFNLVFENRIYY